METASEGTSSDAKLSINSSTNSGKQLKTKQENNLHHESHNRTACFLASCVCKRCSQLVWFSSWIWTLPLGLSSEQ